MNGFEKTLQPGLIVAMTGGILALVAIGFGLWRFLRKRPTPQELEQRRRLHVNSKGKLGDGEVIDVEGTMVVYSYLVAGVGYTTSQDVSALAERLPLHAMAMIGPAAIKFDPRNPANSIVVCEEWSGLQKMPAR